MRILIAGAAGAVAMFIWMTVAHIMTPLGWIGFSQIPDEAPVVAAMQGAIQKDGLYLFPWVDPKSPEAMAQYKEKVKTSASGLLIYKAPPGSDAMTKQLVIEFVTEFVACLLAAFLLAQTMIASYAMRAGFVALVGVTIAIASQVSYWNWYNFPTDYTAASIFTQIVGFIVAGLAIAFFIKPKAA